MEKKLGPTEFEAEIKALQAAGKLPPLEDVLGAVASIREKYRQPILDAREKGDNIEGL